MLCTVFLLKLCAPNLTVFFFRIKIIGELPDIVLLISNDRLMELLKLLLSIPTPAPEKEIDALGQGITAAEVLKN